MNQQDVEDVELGEKPTPQDDSNKSETEAPNKVLTKKSSMASTKGKSDRN